MKKNTKKNVLCKRCSKCCVYVCVEIDRPEKNTDFDDIAWMLAHKKISIRVEGKRWYILFDTKCGHLDRNGFCKIYKHRPRICRRYKPGPCDYTIKRGEKDKDADHIFYDIKELYEYRDKKID